MKLLITEEQKKILMENQKFDYGCLMVKFTPSWWHKFLNEINDEDLYDKKGEDLGKEEESHVTILFGFKDNEIKTEDIKNIVKDTQSFTIELTGISYFDNEEYDVLKFDVKSNKLHELNNKASNLPHEQLYPDYNPHMTIAYLQKGTADKYTKKFNNPIELKSEYFYYTDTNGEKTYFNHF